MAYKPISIYIGGLAAANASNIAGSQTPTVASGFAINGALVTSGNTATIDVARRVVITPTGDESANVITLTGTDRYNHVITEAITGGNAAAVVSKQDFKTVTAGALSANAANAITLGTSNTATSAWIKLNQHGLAPVSIGVDLVSGTANFTVEATMDDPDWAYPPGYPTTNQSGNLAGTNYLPVAYNHPTAAGNTASTFDCFGMVSTNPKPFATRVKINTGSGFLMFNVIQSGLANS